MALCMEFTELDMVFLSPTLRVAFEKTFQLLLIW